ncbi:MAG: hypothetical protein HFE98_10485 [Ruminiclostridium sp.]|nr:hypothetical protein [Ruminiclostridium sp.]
MAIHDSRERIQQMEDSIDAGVQEHLRQDEALSLMETKGLLRDHWVGYVGIDETEQTMYRTEPKISVSMVPGQVTECVLVLTDAQGLSFHYTAFRYQAEETRADFFRAHQCDISTQVYGPGGTLLYTLPGDGSIPNTEEEGIQWKG